jgi:hypothetical protein
MPGAITGKAAVIKWTYYTAAAINGYSITRGDNGITRLIATVVQQDRFKLSQRPLIFEAKHAKGAWTWPIVDYTIADSGRLVARLGPEIPGDKVLNVSIPET